MSIKHRVKTIEKRLKMSMPHFYIPIFSPYSPGEVFGILNAYGLNPKCTGTIALISMSNGTFGFLDYDPEKLETLERELESKQKEFEAAKKAAYEEMLEREKEKLEITRIK